MRGNLMSSTKYDSNKLNNAWNLDLLFIINDCSLAIPTNHDIIQANNLVYTEE